MFVLDSKAGSETEMAKRRIDSDVMTAPSGLFNYCNKGCECHTDLRHDDYGNPRYILRVMANDKIIPFRHQFDEGLKLVENHGDNTRDPVRDMPRTQECVDIFRKLGINDDIPLLKKDIITEKRLSENIENYFKKYGFLFPADKYKFDEFEITKVGALFDRVAILLELMNAVDGVDVDYNRIFHLTFMLALRKLEKFENREETKTYFESVAHPLYKTFKSINFAKKDLNSEVSEIDLYKYIERSPEYEKQLYYEPIDYRIGKAFKNGEEVLPERFSDIYIIRDYFLDSVNWFLMRVSDYEDRIGEAELLGESYETIHIFNIEKRIKYMFVHAEFSDRSDKLFFDFLFHLHFEVCNILSINTDRPVPITLEDGANLNCNEKFNDKFKEVLRELAGITIKNELDQMTASIRTEYNAKTRFQSWFVPNLYTAIYYAISLTNREFYVYRTCANPYCNCIFSIPFTNDRRRYCSEECQWQSAQRLKRAKEKRKEAEEKAKPQKNSKN